MAPSGGAAVPPKVEQPHGGALYVGGVPGHRGGPGRPPSALRQLARDYLEDVLPKLYTMGMGDPMPVSVVTAAGEVEERAARPSFADRRGAADSLIKLGQGPQLGRDEVVSRLKAMTEIVQRELGTDRWARLAPELVKVWEGL